MQLLRQKPKRKTKEQRQALAKIAEQLKYGDIAKICTSTGKSRSTVTRHLNGAANGEATVQAALRLIETRIRKSHKIQERAKAINA